MREARRKIEDVARFKNPTVSRLKFLQKPNGKVWDKIVRRYGPILDHPFARAGCLNEEHIEVVDVSAHVPLIDSVADHDIIHSPKRDE
jgi:hypothetical protein